jgi:hypothetical protein
LTRIDESSVDDSRIDESGVDESRIDLDGDGDPHVGLWLKHGGRAGGEPGSDEGGELEARGRHAESGFRRRETTGAHGSGHQPACPQGECFRLS